MPPDPFDQRLQHRIKVRIARLEAGHVGPLERQHVRHTVGQAQQITDRPRRHSGKGKANIVPMGAQQTLRHAQTAPAVPHQLTIGRMVDVPIVDGNFIDRDPLRKPLGLIPRFGP